MRLGRGLAAAGVALACAAPAIAATTPKRKVYVHDNYYQADKLTVKAGTQVSWVWADDATDVHDVQLVSAPKGVKKFQSEPLASGLSFRKKLTRPGLYKFVCSFHEEEMRMQIRVKKPVKKRR
ncbi:MAG: cupredoxin domain-containing protein [Solirubrobacterales bacterium]|nr:cupredoxin domain-containing protein [Solirubrobacterales bacterium]